MLRIFQENIVKEGTKSCIMKSRRFAVCNVEQESSTKAYVQRV